jgi:hypothetical protein
MADNLPIGQPIRNQTVDPSNAPDNTKKLMSPNAREDPEAVTGDNPQKEWINPGGKPKAPYGQQGRNF